MAAEDYVGKPGFEKKLHQTHFGIARFHGGNERVKVKTSDGYTYMSREQAEELELEIVERKVDHGREKQSELS